MKQPEIKQPKKKRAARLRKFISVIGGTIGFAIILYKILTKRKKQLPTHEDIYIPIGSSIIHDEEIAVTKEISHHNEVTEYIEEQEPAFEKIIYDILHNELLSAKKVWVIDSNLEEMQVEKLVYEEDGCFCLGNSNKNIKFQDICKLKYRSKIYFDRDSIRL